MSSEGTGPGSLSPPRPAQGQAGLAGYAPVAGLHLWGTVVVHADQCQTKPPEEERRSENHPGGTKVHLGLLQQLLIMLVRWNPPHKDNMAVLVRFSANWESGTTGSVNRPWVLW